MVFETEVLIMFFDNVSFLCCVLNNESDKIINLQRFIKFMLNTKSVKNILRHDTHISKKSDFMRS